jgi:protein-S-isoprenylcysteine O-methyltransferase Ste14
MSTTASPHPQSSVLPPRGLLLALLGQVPLIIGRWPLQPSRIEMLAGGALIAAGVALDVWADGLFKRNAVGVRPFSSTPVLVTRGPFALSRHPMYLGLVAIAAGAAIATGVLANVWVSVAFAIWLHYAYVLPEERFLRDRFGAAYDEYCERVPRWLLIKRRSAPIATLP